MQVLAAGQVRHTSELGRARARYGLHSVHAPPGGHIDILEHTKSSEVVFLSVHGAKKKKSKSVCDRLPFNLHVLILSVLKPPSRWLILQRERGAGGRCVSCRVAGSTFLLPYGAGEAASAWGLANRMVAGSFTHKHEYNARTRSNIHSEVRQNRITILPVAHAKPDTDKVEPIRKISIGTARAAAVQLLSLPRLNYL